MTDREDDYDQLPFEKDCPACEDELWVPVSMDQELVEAYVKGLLNMLCDKHREELEEQDMWIPTARHQWCDDCQETRLHYDTPDGMWQCHVCGGR